MNLTKFKSNNLFDAGIDFFSQLHVPLKTKTAQSIPAKSILDKQFKDVPLFNSIKETYYLGLIDNSIFSNTDSEGLSLDETLQRVNERYDGIMVFAVKIENYSPNRTDIANIVRAFNKASKKVPVIVLLNYSSNGNNLLTFSATERIQYLQNWRDGEKLGKVSLLKDINIQQPHTGHIKILEDLTLKSDVRTFEALYKQWREVFDVQLLNRRFYQEIAIWYFWALKNVEFPETISFKKLLMEYSSSLHSEKKAELRNELEAKIKEIENKIESIKATNLIRLLTRLIFVWFLKEKHLVPEELFDENYIASLLDFKDKTGSTYYKAILQNLFFATLNTPMKKDNSKSRIFIDEAKSKDFINDGYLQSGYFRYKRFLKNSDALIEKYSSIPFLNGGLFECLDEKINDIEVRIDCFSDNPKNEIKLKVPDDLFFGIETKVDLNKIFDTKNKDYKTRGLIIILNSYKFTVTENTPIEEEIALDPELLGKVFENLLASYNPETGTTARKATGSFYTPREIVNYMVDESLIAYLEQKLIENGVTDLYSDKLKQLLTYTDQPHQFNKNEVIILIDVIENLKILDPACGSGAFPMGVLHKLVFILHKLDPDNHIWKQKLIDRTPQEIRDETKKALANKPLDYIRKLGLIESCIYGVDIQPIAIQITKLRFFISLIVEQKIDDTKENRDIKSLPNLETKFVAANTLIGLDKPKDTLGFVVKDIQDAEDYLLNIRKDIFYANSSSKKKQLAIKEKAAREKLKLLLEKKGGFGHNTAEQISGWDPFNLNASSCWFDPEFMFGISNGFDIVIGNPPYVAIQRMEVETKIILQNIKYKTYENTGDIYAVFYERGQQLLKNNGILSYITSRQWMQASYGKSLRKFLATETNPIQLIDFGKIKIFEGATVFVNIILFEKNKNKNNLLACLIPSDYNVTNNNLSDFFTINNQKIKILTENTWSFSDPLQINEKIEKIGLPLNKWKNIEFFRGITSGLNDAFYIEEPIRNELIRSDSKNAKIIKPLLRGKDIKRYSYEYDNWYILNIHNGVRDVGLKRIDVVNDYPKILEHLNKWKDQLELRQDKGEHWTNLRNCAFLLEFEKPKIVWIEISDRANYAYDENGMYLTNSAYFLTCNSDKVSLKYLLAILNSKVADFYFSQKTARIAGGRMRYTKQYVEQIPIPETSLKEQKHFIDLVNTILDKRNKGENTNKEETKIDILVYKLYKLTYDEVKIIDHEFSLSSAEYENYEVEG
jgi:hypothetical protein